MQDFLNKAGKIAADMANKAGSKAEELAELGKIKVKINSENQEIAQLKKQIGDYCYDLFENGKLKDKKIAEICASIQEHMETIEDLEIQVQEAKDGYKEKTDSPDPTLED